MKPQPPSTETATPEAFDAVRRCYDAYGADVAKWPAAARAEYSAIAHNLELTEARENAAALDGFLNAASAPKPAADLKSRIFADYAPPALHRSFIETAADWVSRMTLVPAGGLAALGALGVVSGVMTANGQAALTPEYEAYAYLEASLPAVDFDEEGAILWDED